VHFSAANSTHLCDSGSGEEESDEQDERQVPGMVGMGGCGQASRKYAGRRQRLVRPSPVHQSQRSWYRDNGLHGWGADAEFDFGCRCSSGLSTISWQKSDSTTSSP